MLLYLLFVLLHCCVVVVVVRWWTCWPLSHLLPDWTKTRYITRRCSPDHDGNPHVPFIHLPPHSHTSSFIPSRCIPLVRWVTWFGLPLYVIYIPTLRLRLTPQGYVCILRSFSLRFTAFLHVWFASRLHAFVALLRPFRYFYTFAHTRFHILFVTVHTHDFCLFCIFTAHFVRTGHHFIYVVTFDLTFSPHHGFCVYVCSRSISYVHITTRTFTVVIVCHFFTALVYVTFSFYLILRYLVRYVLRFVFAAFVSFFVALRSPFYVLLHILTTLLLFVVVVAPHTFTYSPHTLTHVLFPLIIVPFDDHFPCCCTLTFLTKGGIYVHLFDVYTLSPLPLGARFLLLLLHPTLILHIRFIPLARTFPTFVTSLLLTLEYGHDHIDAVVTRWAWATRWAFE